MACSHSGRSPPSCASMNRSRSFLVPTKRVIVLANSIKRQARCIAGREVISEGGGTRIGLWVRSVSGENEGELLSHHYTLSDGVLTGVLDIVDIPLIQPKDEPGQPENWLLDEEGIWSKVEEYGADQVHQLEETPTDLWLQTGQRTDRISVEVQRQRSPQHSLVGIRMPR